MKLFHERHRAFRDLVDTCATEDLVVFVGAGVSIESDLPRWSELVKNYVNIALAQHRTHQGTIGHDDADEEITDQMIESVPELQRVASMADHLLPASRRLTVLEQALYDPRHDPVPGPTAKELAKLYRARSREGLATHLITTNYDPLLEIALDEFGDSEWLPATGHSFVDIAHLEKTFYEFSCASQRGPDGRHEPVVLHLHGMIDFRVREADHPGTDAFKKPILFTESSYAVHYYPSIVVLSEAIRDRPCLMVGLGFNDWDVINAMYHLKNTPITMKHSSPAQVSDAASASDREKSSKERKAGAQRLFAVGLEADWLKHNQLIQDLNRKRLEDMGLTVLTNLKSYSQIPQVIHELQLRVRYDDYWEQRRYGLRFEKWWNAFDDAYLGDDDDVSTQVSVSRQLHDAVGDVKRLVRNVDVDDYLAIHVWVRRFDEYKMFLWASSEYARRGDITWGLEEEIKTSERHVAIKQAFEGRPGMEFEEADRWSRWKQVLAVPIISHTTDATHGFERLLVGVVTLSSNLAPAESAIGKSIADDRSFARQLQGNLEELGCRILVDDL